MKGLGPTQRKLLILLFGWAAVGLARSPGRQWYILKELKGEWDKATREENMPSKQSLSRSIQKLYDSKLVDIKQEKDGTWKMVLTENGKEKVLQYNLGEHAIVIPKHWDRKWRIVLFDIPEEKRRGRDMLRGWLKKLKFHQLQASVFVHPYDCRDEYEFLVEMYGLRKYVRYAVLKEIDNEKHLKKIFHLK
jgi:DNA-binding transcriptional ArsR family regulator